jgi:glycine/D-amino acid oxidase-like deaminating enzyme
MSSPVTSQSNQFSLWSATSGEPPLEAAPACGSLRADIVVVGAGYTGLSAALHLAERGMNVTIIEAGLVGAGASGANGGQVIPGLKRDPEDLKRIFGGKAPGLIDLFGNGSDMVFSLIERYSIDCSPRRAGWILAAHATSAMPPIKERCRQWHARGADVDLLSAADIVQLTGTDAYAGGFIDRRAGTIQPLAYARGLARAARRHGAVLYENSRVESLVRRGSNWRLGGPGFEIEADRVVIATDAYSGRMLPLLEQSLLTVSSLQIATEPLPQGSDAAILSTGACVSETRKVAIYMRRDPEGRLLIGGRGPVGNGSPDRLYSGLYERLVKIFPDVRGIGLSHRWQGKVSLTLDELPHLHEPEPGLSIGLGYNGRGVAAATTMGKIITDRIIGGALSDILPVIPLSGVPWRLVRQPLLTAAVSYYRLRDRLGFGV